MSPTVAIVEDEEDLRGAVAEYLTGCGLRILAAASAEEFRVLAQSEALDVAVLDIAMPDETGLSLARWIKARGSRPGIIFATAAGKPHDRIRGLELGDDDYIVKPYELRELLARIKSILRRLPEESGRRDIPAMEIVSSTPVIQIGRLSLEPESGRLAGGEAVSLSHKELELLLALARRPNRLLTRAQLLNLACTPDSDLDIRSIDVRIARLRAKVEPTPDKPRYIRTVRGEGYMFVPDGNEQN